MLFRSVFGARMGFSRSADRMALFPVSPNRSEERRVGKECRSRWFEATITDHVDQTPRYRVNDAPLSQSRSPTWQAKHLCYIVNVCAIETRFRLRRPQPPTLHVCLLMCVPHPVPIHCTSEGTAGDGCSWETAVLSHVCRVVSRSSHAVAISKQRTYPRVNSQKLD